jgi:hypothetical protein
LYQFILPQNEPQARERGGGRGGTKEEKEMS